MNSVAIVERFWKKVWQSPQNPDAIDELVAENFIITSGGQDIVGRAAFKAWVKAFQAKIQDLEFDIIESFQNDRGDRVASRWRIRGRNKGFLNTPANGRPFEMTGTAVWAIDDDGLLLHNWVERNAFEVAKLLLAKTRAELIKN